MHNTLTYFLRKGAAVRVVVRKMSELSERKKVELDHATQQMKTFTVSEQLQTLTVDNAYLRL